MVNVQPGSEEWIYAFIMIILGMMISSLILGSRKLLVFQLVVSVLLAIWVIGNDNLPLPVWTVSLGAFILALVVDYNWVVITSLNRIEARRKPPEVST